MRKFEDDSSKFAMANGGKGVKSERMMQYIPKRGFIRRAKQKERMIVLTHTLLQCVKVSAKVS